MEKLAGRGGVNGVFIYICKGVRRWVGSPGDWIAVDTAEKGELQFLAPGLFLEILEFRGVRVVPIVKPIVLTIMTNQEIAQTPSVVPEMIGLTVDSALINRLGYELVGRAETAMSELIKNGYDADAKRVDVFFNNTDQPGGTIIVRDNGVGMDFQALQQGFLRISTSDKVDNPKSERYERPRAGRKGIGRFATQRLGNVLTIITTKLEMNYALKVTIDWTAYRPNTNLEDILFPIEKVEKSLNEGTELVISGVRDTWSMASILRVHRYVMDLFQPDYLRNSAGENAVENTFETFFWRWDGSQYAAIENGQEDFFAKALAVISGEVNDDHHGWVSIRSDSLLMKDDIPLENEFPLLSKVRFKAYYFIYGRPEYYSSGMSAMTLNAIQKMSVNSSGLRLYRNGFRVLPYGEPSNDWINLNARWAGGSGVNIPFGTHNIFGYVEIVDQEGLLFDETSSREGLIENDAFFQLTDFLYRAFSMARNRISSSPELQRLKDNRGATDPSEPQPEVQAGMQEKLAYIRSYLQNKKEPAGSEEERHRERVIEMLSAVERVMGEMEMLRVLAGLGLSIGSFSHEMEQFKPALVGDLSHLLRNDMPINEIAESLNKHLETMFAYTRFFNITVSENLNRRLGPVDVFEIIDRFRRTIEDDLGRQQIQFEFVPRVFDLMVGPMHEAELISVLYNLYTNARKAIIKNNQPGEILITAGIEGVNAFLCFQDNGIGIPEENKNRVFDAFFTTSTPASFSADEQSKLTGTGLGLKIVQDILLTRGGKIFLFEPDVGFKTCFKIVLPRVV